jgi:hypothetical protein
MLRSAVGNVVWVGRATVFLVGLAVILALLFGVASTALGANGDFFKVGKTNLASAISTLKKSGAGPALNLEVGSGPPLKLSSQARVAKLNADKIDGLDSTALVRKGAGEQWHEINTPGEPNSALANYGGGYNTAAFYKDPLGIVHLKGRMKLDRQPGDPGFTGTVFDLPRGYHPAATEVHAATGTGGEWVIEIYSGGAVYSPKTFQPQDWISLDGITFRVKT